MTAVQDWVSTSVSMKPLDIFKETMRSFLAMFVWAKNRYIKSKRDL